MKWWILALAILVVVAAIGAYFFFSNRPEDMTNPCADVKVAAFGDSLIAGYGASEGNDLVSKLEQGSGIPISNFGKNGDTSASALTRIDTVIAAKPDVVIVLVGGNDALQRTPVSETKANLENIITTLQSEDIEVVLLGVIGGFPSDPFRSMFQELSGTYGVEHVPNVLSGIIGHQELMTDQIHPNDAGYARMAEKVLPTLLAACGS